MLRKAAFEAKCTVDEEERSGSRQVCRRTFVAEKTFLELYKDRFKNNMPERDNAFINKKVGTIAGFWVRGSLGNGAEGHYEFEDYEECDGE